MKLNDLDENSRKMYEKRYVNYPRAHCVAMTSMELYRYCVRVAGRSASMAARDRSKRPL